MTKKETIINNIRENAEACSEAAAQPSTACTENRPEIAASLCQE